MNNPLKYTDPSGELIPFFVIPSINWSKDGGIDISITAGIGFYKGLSAQTTIGYSFGSNNFYAQNGVSAWGATAYYGWGSQSGNYCGVSYGLSNGSGLSSNISSLGVSYSENGGWGGNFSIFQINNQGDVSINPSLSYSYSFNNFKQVRVDERNRYNLQMALNKYDANGYFASNSSGAYHGYPNGKDVFKGSEFVDFYYGAPVWENSKFNDGSGITLPPYGIFVGQEAYYSPDPYYAKLLAHEYGHWLQYREYGTAYYYRVIAPYSLRFALFRNNYGWTELNANYRGYNNLSNPTWWHPNDPQFPLPWHYDALSY